MQAMEISLTGLDVEWRRLEIISQNLANANSVRNAQGHTYQPLHLVSGPKGDFQSLLDLDARTRSMQANTLRGVAVYGIEESSVAPRMVYEPDNPQADADGYVGYPGIDHARQMTLMIKTSRVYEANMVAFSTARQMYSTALGLGRQA
jgi:flagellar basal-body rod protein FlgC